MPTVEWNSSSEGLEVWDFHRSGAAVSARGEKEGSGREHTQRGVGISWVALGEIGPLQTLQAPANGLSSTGDKGARRGWITCSLLFTVTYHRFHTLHRPGLFFQDKGHYSESREALIGRRECI